MIDEERTLRWISNMYISIADFEKRTNKKPDWVILTAEVCSTLGNNRLVDVCLSKKFGTRVVVPLHDQHLPVRMLDDLPDHYKNRALKRARGISSPFILCYTGGIFRERLRKISAYDLNGYPPIIRWA